MKDVDTEFAGFQTSFEWFFNTHYSKHKENIDYISIMVGGEKASLRLKAVLLHSQAFMLPKESWHA